jgi:hypothetical protein
VDASIRPGPDNPTGMYQVTFSYAEPALDVSAGGSPAKIRTFYVPQSGPMVYQVDLPRPAEGAYRAVLAYQVGDGPAQEVAAPFAVSPPAEWLPGKAAEGQSTLAAWANLANGQVTTLEAVMTTAKDVETPARHEIIPAWLLLALLLLWPVEIALRRRWLPWQ